MLMSLGRLLSIRRMVIACLALGLMATVAFAQLQGRVIDRNGAPQSGCQLDFSAGPGQPILYHFVTNRDGSFYLTNVRVGRYLVLAGYGPGKQFSLYVNVGSQSLDPSTLVATW